LAYKSSIEYHKGIEDFINELGNDGKSEASKRMRECYDCINGTKEEWKMFYKKLVFMKDEFSFKFSKDENRKMEDIIEAAKRIVFSI
jgi:hypothetical protein